MKMRLFCLIVLLVTAAACGGSSDSDSSATTATTTTATTNLRAVNESMVPSSLNYTQNAAASVSRTALAREASGDPCADVDGLVECQPILLQLYMEMSQEIQADMIDVVANIGAEMGSLADGATGTETIEGYTVEYSKTNDTNYSVLLSVDSTAVGYVAVNGTTYTLTFDVGVMSGGERGESEMMSTVVSYTDENTWESEIFIAGIECSDDDVPAPDSIKLIVSKANGLWTGKAMLYSDLWRSGEDATCDTEVTDDTTMNIYTDFVGNDDAAKASVYMMDRTISDLTSISTHELSDYVANYGEGFGITEVYENPFCNPAGTLEALWGNACTDYATIEAADFGSADDWVVPSDFYQQTITVPTSL